MGVKAGIDPLKLDDSGWGLILPHDADPLIKEALGDLLALRREQAGGRFRLFSGPDGHRPGESKIEFLRRHGSGPGPADPDKVPYYLLIAGGPERIPYRFQQQLSVQYAVGRIHFSDLNDYSSYAQSVVAAETGGIKQAREVAFFAPDNPGDPATATSMNTLARPLFEQLSAAQRDWQIRAYLGNWASKRRLGGLLGGEETPALLFVAAHGLAFANGASRQLDYQGALLCQDWAGAAEARQAFTEKAYFSAADLADDATLAGMVALFYASYSAGSPRLDKLLSQASRESVQIAPDDFLARLPLQMLAHGQGGALAVIGLIDQAWGYAFEWAGTATQTEVLADFLRGLLDGQRVGHALEYVNILMAENSGVLAGEMEDIEFGKQIDPNELAGLWASVSDARSLTIIGDPAVRLPVAAAGETPLSRPVLDLKQFIDHQATDDIELGDVSF